MTAQTEAILLTKDNAPAIAEGLGDYTLEDVLFEFNTLSRLGGHVVLGTAFYDGERFVAYIVHESLYKANNSNFAELNDQTYTKCVQI